MRNVVQQQVPEGYQQTEIGVIPEDWQIKNAGDVFTKIQDGTHFSPKVGGNGYLYVTSKNIRTRKMDLSTAEYIDERQHRAIYKRCDVKKGDILLTKDGANTGNAALNNLDEEFSLLSSVAFLRVNEKTDCAEFYLQQIISPSFQQTIQVAMSGNAITRLTLDKINKLIFFVPRQEEQTAIANALSDVDALITSLEKLIAKKRAIKTAAMQQLLTGKKRLPPFDQAHTGYKQTELGEIPEDWEVRELQEVAKVKGGKRLPKGEQLLLSPTKHPYVRVVDMQIGGVELSDIRYVSEDIAQVIKNYRIKSTDIFISVAGTIGIVGKIPDSLDGANLTENADRITDMTVERDYLMYWLMSEKIQTEIDSKSTVGAQPKLALGMIEGFRIAFPGKLYEQAAIAQVLTDIEAEVTALDKSLNKTQQLKQGMMQELLTGRTRLV